MTPLRYWPIPICSATFVASVVLFITRSYRRRKSVLHRSIEFKIRPGDGKSLGVGVCVFILSPEKHPGCVLLGRRQGSDGAGTYALPGGHLEFGESVIACAERETLEETALKLVGTCCVGLVNAVEKDDDYHYVTPVCIGYTNEEPINLEPNKCDGWSWERWDSPDFPAPLFSGLRKLREAGYNPTLTPPPKVVVYE